MASELDRELREAADRFAQSGTYIDHETEMREWYARGLEAAANTMQCYCDTPCVDEEQRGLCIDCHQARDFRDMADEARRGEDMSPKDWSALANDLRHTCAENGPSGCAACQGLGEGDA